MELSNKRKFVVTSDLLASQGQRFGNYFIDLVFQYVLIFLISIIVIIISELFDSDSFVIWIENIGGFEEYIFGIIVMVFYYVIAESYFSRTIGKLITKTVVVDINGEKPESATILKRTLCRLIPFNHFSFFGGNARGWHDSISNTYVVSKELFDAKKKQFYELDEIGISQE